MKKKMRSKVFLSLLLVASMLVLMLSGCGKKGGDDVRGGGSDASGEGEEDNLGMSEDASFGWWIFTTDGAGQYYEKYEDNPAVQWILNQYWDAKNGGIGTEETGKKLDLSFITPIAGSEADNFSTMISTGEYPEIIDLQVSTDSDRSLYNNGVLLELTDYIKKYMPNYLKMLDENPELKPFCLYEDEDGTEHYYSIKSIADKAGSPWEGYNYRRDWVVKYAEPTEYVWDWESDAVKKNGHPDVTPLSKAVEEKNLNGWKENEVKEFTADYGENPNEDYKDNVIFPSGTEDPLTISDWEWMFEAFEKAIADRGWEDNSSAYGISLYYLGYMATGDLVSSFGGGNGGFYRNKKDEMVYDGTSENFKTYLECMHNWYEEGWLDKNFSTRSADMFFQINTTGYSQGMVGMWCGTIGGLGDAIRVTCANEEDVKDAYVMPCALPINDMYGDEGQMYQEPDCLYQGGRVNVGIGLTTKAEEKDIATLLTFMDWSFTEKGGVVGNIGLNEEQLSSVEFNPDVYGDNGLKAAYIEEERDDGVTVYKFTFDLSGDLGNAVKSCRLTMGRNMSGREDWGYVLDKGYNMVTQKADTLWSKYTATGSTLDYGSIFTEEESDKLSKFNAAANDYLGIAVPGLIVDGLDGWDEYCKKMADMNPDEIVEIYAKYGELGK